MSQSVTVSCTQLFSEVTELRDKTKIKIANLFNKFIIGLTMNLALN